MPPELTDFSQDVKTIKRKNDAIIFDISFPIFVGNFIEISKTKIVKYLFRLVDNYETI